jgi:hypothetical protein
MALNVETGTGSATSEAYISVADASTYHTNRGNAAWAALASDTVREQCLRKATDYLEAMYEWQGVRVSETQALDWPRYGVVVNSWEVDSDTIPEAIKRACAELALKASTGDLLADLTRGVLREKVDVIEVQYDPNSPEITRYSFIDAMLKPYCTGGSKVNVPLYRV